MIRRDVQRLEVVKVILDLGPGRDLEARPGEDPLDAQARPGDGMDAAPLLATSRQGDIQGTAGELGPKRLLVQLGTARVERPLNRGLGLVDFLARCGPLTGR